MLITFKLLNVRIFKKNHSCILLTKTSTVSMHIESSFTSESFFFKCDEQLLIIN